MAIREKRNWIQEVGRLKGRIKLLERDCNLFFQNQKSPFTDDYHDIIEDLSHASALRKDNYSRIHDDIVNVKKIIKKTKGELASGRFADNISELQLHLEETEKQIFNQKNNLQIQLNDMIEMEQELDSELRLISEKADLWASEPLPDLKMKISQSSPSKAGNRKIMLRNEEISEKAVIESDYEDGYAQNDISKRKHNTLFEEKLPIDVAMYQDFIGDHGLTDGWSDPDHNHFVKVYFKHTSHSAMIEELQRLFGFRSEEELKQHIRFYERLLQLQERKQNALAEWKRKKEMRVKKIAEEFSDEVDEQSKDDEIKQKQKIAQLQKQIREEKKKQIALWKEEKQRIEREAALTELKKKREEERQKQEQEKHRREEIEKKLLQRRLEIENEEQQRQTILREQQRKRALSRPSSASLIEKSRFGMIKAVERREAAMKLEKDKMKKSAIVLNATPTVVAKRDASRLLRPTSAFSTSVDLQSIKESKKEGIGRKTTQSNQNYILSVQSRSVPSWRRGI
ncbi:uncharacterized protein MONOS_13379 [Monocercomonoides exilis]|uniref:uncharacterized protein n=1 Tax=Monocercomonoides exilis TaxID=2049356 RepID=UPI0035597FAA|nr:hypothetical protein MONOS_13379 [Monocercomonoides exilis]|eukprot:MONOS_13379.1-p1 / transcript=MONOS_13379.1 / gene=MONOS_13379 / organism=Monocercomonoides_exilis_PA203 / gene_product=unspecified product / transcript_product=unspecified product / location=Mono_scaffold00819:2221-4805(-) / protein_length=512 / sequence_SO=supercontig / SO=protein_coding / is_pseudo=false